VQLYITDQSRRPGPVVRAGKLADLWLAADKLQHLLFCAAVVVCTFVAARKVLPLGRNASLAVGVLASLVLGTFKELGDHLKVRQHAHYGACMAARGKVLLTFEKSCTTSLSHVAHASVTRSGLNQAQYLPFSTAHSPAT
jgi:hypothetical protein